MLRGISKCLSTLADSGKIFEHLMNVYSHFIKERELGRGGTWEDQVGTRDGEKCERVNYNRDERQDRNEVGRRLRRLLMRAKWIREGDKEWLKDKTGCNWTAGVRLEGRRENGETQSKRGRGAYRFAKLTKSPRQIDERGGRGRQRAEKQAFMSSM